MEDKEIEYAEMNAVRVLETNVLHASDVIFWLNGTSAETLSDMTRVPMPLDLSFSAKPKDARIINSAGKTAFLRTPTNDFVQGVATEADKVRPEFDTYEVIGEAWDSSRRFNPARIDLTLGSGLGEAIVIYPSPVGTQKSPGGSLFGRLLMDDDESPVIWGLLTLVVTLSESETQTYRAQTDAHGDFVIPLNRLPPLPESITEYDAVLSLSTNTANTVTSAPDTTTYSATELQSSSTNAFNANFALQVTPGSKARISSNAKDYLAATTS